MQWRARCSCHQILRDPYLVTGTRQNIPIFFSTIDSYRFSYSYPSCKDLKNFNSVFDISYFLKLGWSLIQLKPVTLSVKLLILRSWSNQCYWFVVIGWLMIWILILSECIHQPHQIYISQAATGIFQTKGFCLYSSQSHWLALLKQC